jgi:hypothetical protein
MAKKNQGKTQTPAKKKDNQANPVAMEAAKALQIIPQQPEALAGGAAGVPAAVQPPQLIKGGYRLTIQVEDAPMKVDSYSMGVVFDKKYFNDVIAACAENLNRGHEIVMLRGVPDYAVNTIGAVINRAVIDSRYFPDSKTLILWNSYTIAHTQNEHRGASTMSEIVFSLEEKRIICKCLSLNHGFTNTQVNEFLTPKNDEIIILATDGRLETSGTVISRDAATEKAEEIVDDGGSPADNNKQPYELKIQEVTVGSTTIKVGSCNLENEQLDGELTNLIKGHISCVKEDLDVIMIKGFKNKPGSNVGITIARELKLGAKFEYSAECGTIIFWAPNKARSIPNENHKRALAHGAHVTELDFSGQSIIFENLKHQFVYSEASLTKLFGLYDTHNVIIGANDKLLTSVNDIQSVLRHEEVHTAKVVTKAAAAEEGKEAEEQEEGKVKEIEQDERNSAVEDGEADVEKAVQLLGSDYITRVSEIEGKKRKISSYTIHHEIQQEATEEIGLKCADNIINDNVDIILLENFPPLQIKALSEIIQAKAVSIKNSIKIANLQGADGVVIWDSNAIAIPASEIRTLVKSANQAGGGGDHENDQDGDVGESASDAKQQPKASDEGKEEPESAAVPIGNRQSDDGSNKQQDKLPTTGKLLGYEFLGYDGVYTGGRPIKATKYTVSKNGLQAQDVVELARECLVDIKRSKVLNIILLENFSIAKWPSFASQMRDGFVGELSSMKIDRNTNGVVTIWDSRIQPNVAKADDVIALLNNKPVDQADSSNAGVGAAHNPGAQAGNADAAPLLVPTVVKSKQAHLVKAVSASAAAPMPLPSGNSNSAGSAVPHAQAASVLIPAVAESKQIVDESSVSHIHAVAITNVDDAAAPLPSGHSSAGSVAPPQAGDAKNAATSPSSSSSAGPVAHATSVLLPKKPANILVISNNADDLKSLDSHAITVPDKDADSKAANDNALVPFAGNAAGPKINGFVKFTGQVSLVASEAMYIWPSVKYWATDIITPLVRFAVNYANTTEALASLKPVIAIANTAYQALPFNSTHLFGYNVSAIPNAVWFSVYAGTTFYPYYLIKAWYPGVITDWSIPMAQSLSFSSNVYVMREINSAIAEQIQNSDMAGTTQGIVLHCSLVSLNSAMVGYMPYISAGKVNMWPNIAQLNAAAAATTGAIHCIASYKTVTENEGVYSAVVPYVVDTLVIATMIYKTFGLRGANQLPDNVPAFKALSAMIGGVALAHSLTKALIKLTTDNPKANTDSEPSDKSAHTDSSDGEVNVSGDTYNTEEDL